MSISFNKICGLSIISQESGNCLGKVEDLIIDYDTGKILALVARDGILRGPMIARAESIRNFGLDRVLVRDDASCEVLRPGRIQDIIQSKIKIKGNKVITQSGTNLGKVIDFEVSLDSNKLSCIFVKTKILGRPLIISWGQIVSIEREVIVVKDEIVKVKTFEPELARA